VPRKLCKINYKISVIIPVTIVDRYLTNCLRSINDSNFVQCEIILVFDKDRLKQIRSESLNALQRILNSFNTLKIIESESEGIVAALNAGLKNAKHNLVARMDADDLVESNRFIIQIDLKNRSGCSVVGGQLTYINEEGAVLRKSKYPISHLEIKYKMKHGCYIAHPAVLYDRDEIIGIGGYRETFNVNEKNLVEDYDLWIRLLLNGYKICNSPDYILKYREHANQASKKLSNEIELASLILRLHYVLGEEFQQTFNLGDAKEKGYAIEYLRTKIRLNKRSIMDQKFYFDKLIFETRLFLKEKKIKTFKFIFETLIMMLNLKLGKSMKKQ
jgi:glycosyltransferase involved in cell wall biosynthesis